jgi:hypothetical protein
MKNKNAIIERVETFHRNKETLKKTYNTTPQSPPKLGGDMK